MTGTGIWDRLFAKAINWFIHPKCRRSTLIFSRAKSTLGCGIITVAIVPSFSLLYYSLHDVYGAIVILLCGLGISSSLLLLRYVGSLQLTREIMIAFTYFGTTWVTYTQGGILSPPAYWLILMPVIAVFLGGRRSVIFWFCWVSATAAVLFILQDNHFYLPKTPISNVVLLQLIAFFGLLCIISALVYFFEIGKEQGFYQLEEEVKLSEHKSNALMRVNQELTMLSTTVNAILTAAGDGIITVNEQNHIHTSNRAISEIFGYSSEELVTKNLSILMNLNPHLNDIAENTQERFLFRATGIRKNGSSFPIEVTISKIDINSEKIKIFVIRDISDREKAEERLAYLAHYDQLTGLPNRALYEILLNNAITRAKRNQTLVILLYLDLDHFKNINDTLGHDSGDILLREVTKCFQQAVRESDIITRLGGDEFAIILEDIHDIDDAKSIAQKIIDSLKRPILINGYKVYTSTSIGIAVFPYNGYTAMILTKNADIAMYHAKEKGRSNYQYFDETLNKRVSMETLIENHLYQALKDNEFFILYQPQYDLKTKKVTAMEALLRWKNQTLGLMQPDDFIPIAEKIGVIKPIGEWVFREACKQFKKWQVSGLINTQAKISINFSIIQFMQEDFINQIVEVLNTSQLHPSSVELELTETLIMHNPEQASMILHQLEKIGIQIALDDFGIGLSSLARLKSLPIHTLKIDKSFVLDSTVNKDSASIIKSVIALGHGLDLIVVAEGVETQEQLKFLQDCKCDRVQGFYFSQPLSTDEMTKLLLSERNKMLHQA